MSLALVGSDRSKQAAPMRCVLLCFGVVVSAFSFSLTAESAINAAGDPWDRSSNARPETEMSRIQTGYSGDLQSLFAFGKSDRGVRVFEPSPSYSLQANYSTKGISANLTFDESIGGSGNQIGGVLSYSYPVKWLDLSFGFAPIWRDDTKLPDRMDLFVETKFKPIQGIVPSVGYYLNVKGRSSQYTELKLAFPYEFNERFRVSSYWKWGFGDIYTPFWTATHSEFGVDTNYKLSKRFDLMAYAGMSIPFEGARKFSGKSDPEGFFGLGVRYGF